MYNFCMCVSAHTDKHLLLWTPTSQLDKSLFITLKYCSFSYGKESSFKLNYLLSTTIKAYCYMHVFTTKLWSSVWVGITDVKSLFSVCDE